MKFRTHIGLFVIVSMVALAAGAKYLAEKPDILTPCKQTDPGFNRCFANNFQTIFSEYKNGVPGLKSLGSIDPLHVKRVAIVEDGSNPVSINIELTNLELIGLSRTIVEDASYNPSKILTTLQITIPAITINSDYDVKGRILSLPLNGKGKALIKIKNLKIEVFNHLKLREEDGFLFTDINKLRLKIKEIGGFHLNLDNLFNGQEVLEQSANALFNDNWRDLYEVMGPSISATVQQIMDDRFRKIFAYIPARYFIEDLV